MTLTVTYKPLIQLRVLYSAKIATYTPAPFAIEERTYASYGRSDCREWASGCGLRVEPGRPRGDRRCHGRRRRCAGRCRGRHAADGCDLRRCIGRHRRCLERSVADLSRQAGLALAGSSIPSSSLSRCRGECIESARRFVEIAIGEAVAAAFFQNIA